MKDNFDLREPLSPREIQNVATNLDMIEIVREPSKNISLKVANSLLIGAIVLFAIPVFTVLGILIYDLIL